MLARAIQGGLFVIALAVSVWSTGAVAQNSPLAAVCRKAGIYVGPQNFQQLQDKPFKLKLETCLDGTAWTNLFNFKLRFDAKLDRLQDTVDAFLNSTLDTCDGHDYSVKITSLDVDTEPPVKDQQHVTLAFDAKATRCSFPRFSVDVSVEVPLALNIYSLRIIYTEPVVTLPRGWSAYVVYIPGLKNYIVTQTVAQIDPYLKNYKDILADYRDRIELFRPVVKKLVISTDKNTVSANLALDARVPKRLVEEQSIAWVNYLQLK